MQTQPMPAVAPRHQPPAFTLPRPAFVAPLLELPIPGAGMLYTGRLRTGLAWLVATLALGFAALLAVARIPNRDYRISVFGIYLVAVLTWLAVRAVLAYAAALEGNVSVGAAPTSQPDVSRAHGLLWVAILLQLAVVGIGIPADRDWHATHVFDTFFSPPHLFIYAGAVIDGLVVAYMVFAPKVRPVFGKGFRLPPFPFPVPGPLMLAGGGMVMLALAGGLDSLWHTAFGLDETGWSTPHAMIGWALLVIFLGFIACRLALRPARPLRWYTLLFFGYLLLGFSATPFMGPLNENTTLAHVAAIARIPVLFAQAAAQHTFRIYETWNLTRTNAIFVPLAALWAGAVLALLRRLDRRAWMLLLITLAWTLISASGDHSDARRLDTYLQVTNFAQSSANWLPLPLFPAAVAFLLARLVRVPERWAWLPAGLVYGFFVVAIWGPYAPLGGLLIVLAAPIVLLGSFVGDAVCGVLERPAYTTVWLLLLVALAVPFLTGSVDLYLRLHTP